MPKKTNVFEEHYNDYLDKISDMDLKSKAKILGAEIDGNDILIPFLGTTYRISNSNITRLSGKRPSYHVCIVLFNYVIRCPHKIPEETTWMSYKDFKDAAPLVDFFTNTVEKSIAKQFSGNLSTLERIIQTVEGKSPDLELSYDFAYQFKMLPRIEILMVFNDRDEYFPDQCFLLFQKKIAHFIDMESVAIAGTIFADYLKELHKKNC
jgi:hypothetical protein